MLYDGEDVGLSARVESSSRFVEIAVGIVERVTIVVFDIVAALVIVTLDRPD